MRIALFAASAVLAWTTAAAWAAPEQRSATDPDWKQAATALELGDSLRLHSIPDTAGRGPDRALLLERFEVIADDATLRIDGGEPVALRPTLTRTYLTGRVEGDPRSRATLIIGERGDVRGLIVRGNDLTTLSADSGGGLVAGDVAADAQPREFSCGADARLTPPPLPASATRAPGQRLRGPTPGGFIARMAIETDFEYFQRFGNVTDATAYAADLIAFSSTVYQAEADTELGISSLSLWTTPGDPWEQSGSSVCRLFEFGKYWNDNNSDVERTLAHFISGRNSNSGIAWVGVLCRGPFDQQTTCSGLPSTSNYGGDYGLSSGIDGNFDIQSPTSVWDIVVVAHEIGHNFNSPHTHCYAGLGGNADDVDQCYNGQSGQGCYDGPESLPGPAGQGSGTIMSYCHLLAPGLSNISLTLGESHPYGVAPERVPNRMLDHVLAREAQVPGCLTTPLVGGVEVIFENGFEAPFIR